MRLREIEFPIAVLRPLSLMGGRNANLHKVGRFDYNLASYYLRGGYDDARIYDATGGGFEVEEIRLYQPVWWQDFLSRAVNLFLPRRAAEPMVTVDMVLRQVEHLELDAFCDKMRSVALDHPNWWKRHSDREEIETMFTGCKTIKDAIEAIGVLEPPGAERLPGHSAKVYDLRPSQLGNTSSKA